MCHKRSFKHNELSPVPFWCLFMAILMNALMNKNNEPKSKQNLQKTDLEIINTLCIILAPNEDQQHHITLGKQNHVITSHFP